MTFEACNLTARAVTTALLLAGLGGCSSYNEAKFQAEQRKQASVCVLWASAEYLHENRLGKEEKCQP